jgi:hypothetical protein
MIDLKFVGNYYANNVEHLGEPAKENMHSPGRPVFAMFDTYLRLQMMRYNFLQSGI